MSGKRLTDEQVAWHADKAWLMQPRVGYELEDFDEEIVALAREVQESRAEIERLRALVVSQDQMIHAQHERILELDPEHAGYYEQLLRVEVSRQQAILDVCDGLDADTVEAALWTAKNTKPWLLSDPDVMADWKPRSER